jgi:hypothetical protein
LRKICLYFISFRIYRHCSAANFFTFQCKIPTLSKVTFLFAARHLTQTPLVIGAGFGRTGTLSLKKALETLGFDPCYHMEEVFFRPFHARRWSQACAGHPVDWGRTLRGYRASVDWPACTFYKELAAAYPEAKIILTVRDPDRWYDSAASTIYPVMQSFPLNRLGRPLPHIGDVGRMLDCLIWEGTFSGHFADREYAIEVYNRHNREVIENISAGRLLIFDVRDGWAPLCAFLDVPIPPNTPFPHVNDHREYWRRVRSLTLALFAGLCVAALGLAALIIGLRRIPPNRASRVK